MARLVAAVADHRMAMLIQVISSFAVAGADATVLLPSTVALAAASVATTACRLPASAADVAGDAKTAPSAAAGGAVG